jgi:hypothetical protein
MEVGCVDELSPFLARCLEPCLGFLAVIADGFQVLAAKSLLRCRAAQNLMHSLLEHCADWFRGTLRGQHDDTKANVETGKSTLGDSGNFGRERRPAVASIVGDAPR